MENDRRQERRLYFDATDPLMVSVHSVTGNVFQAPLVDLSVSGAAFLAQGPFELPKVHVPFGNLAFRLPPWPSVEELTLKFTVEQVLLMRGLWRVGIKFAAIEAEARERLETAVEYFSSHCLIG
jgi:PilZ domain-containing protein